MKFYIIHYLAVDEKGNDVRGNARLKFTEHFDLKLAIEYIEIKGKFTNISINMIHEITEQEYQA